jgi:4-hydroxy-2-oxoheptanedioate aldolase
MPVGWINKQRLLERQLGTFLNLGNACAARMAADLGFDWVLIDLEHGAGSEHSLPNLTMAIEGTSCSPIVRVVSNHQDQIKRALDLGAAGVMVPYISTANEATAAVSFTRYPPRGVRGVASSTVATGFGLRAEQYQREAEAQILTIVQIETGEGVENAEQIAAVEGVDVLFVGPLDLSFQLGCPRNFEHPTQVAALGRVVAACRKHGKAAGILSNIDNVADHLRRGFNFVAIGSESAALIDGFQRLKKAAT